MSCDFFQVPDIIAEVKAEMRKIAQAQAPSASSSDNPDSQRAEQSAPAATAVPANTSDNSGTQCSASSLSQRKPTRVSFWCAMEQEQSAAKRLKQSDVTDLDARLVFVAKLFKPHYLCNALYSSRLTNPEYD